MFVVRQKTAQRNEWADPTNQKHEGNIREKTQLRYALYGDCLGFKKPQNRFPTKRNVTSIVFLQIAENCILNMNDDNTLRKFEKLVRPRNK